MSFTSGSILQVLLQNGASANTGPFDIYVNSISSSGNLIANNVDKATLSGSGYTFTAPVETFQVIAQSDSSCFTTDIVYLGNLPGENKSISITGSYDSSLTAGLVTASIFLDNGYGLQSGGTVPAALNSCPSIIGTGTGSINGDFNTLVVVKQNETGSEYIRFFANGNPISTFFYHIPAFSGSGVNVTNTNICIDLSGGGYITNATNSINVYPTASIQPVLSEFNTSGSINEVNGWLILKANGNIAYSSSVSGTGSIFSVPGNALVEITSSLLQPPSWTTGSVATTSSINLRWSYLSEYTDSNITTLTQQQVLSSGGDKNLVYYSFYAVPGANYTTNITDIITF